MGRLRHYDNAKFFRIEQRPLNNLHDFVTLLSQLEHDLRACVPACLRACVPACLRIAEMRSRRHMIWKAIRSVITTAVHYVETPANESQERIDTLFCLVTNMVGGIGYFL
ncbi:hypothetical protein [Xylella fastidiosa]|uniref:hypothetical protein n=1 Tax=Xylella fastidiosa TaxID=2371 RepID=UPI001FFDB771|nr:hypothetical protein [Xylella fastidiosa]